MKSKIVLVIAILFLTIQVNSQTTVKSFKEAQALSIADNKPIFLKVKYSSRFFNNAFTFDGDYKFINNPEVTKILKNYVVLELYDNSTDHKYLRYLNRSGKSGLRGGNVLDPIANSIGYAFIGGNSSKTDKTALDSAIEGLIRNSFDVSPLKEEYKAIIKNNDVNSKISLIEKYLNNILNNSLLGNEKQKKHPSSIYVVERYIKELIKENKKNNSLKESDKQRLELLGLYRMFFYERYSRVAKKLQKMNVNSISESNKSLFYYLSYVSNLKAKKETVAKEWLDKLKPQKDFDHYEALSKKV